MKKTNEIIRFGEIIPFEEEEAELDGFPTDCLPDVLKRYVKAVAENTETSEEMAATIALGIISSCVQGKYYVQGKKNHTEQLSLYTFVVADPAERKTPVFEMMAKPIKDYQKMINEKLEKDRNERQWERRKITRKIETLKLKLGNDNSNDIEEQISRLERELDQKPEIELLQLYTNDCTSEGMAKRLSENAGRMSVVSTEGGIFDKIAGSYSHGVPNLDVWLEGYDGDDLVVDRSGADTISVPNAHVSMVVTGQPKVFESFMSNEVIRKRGFVARFLFSFPKSLVGKRRYFTNDISDEDMENYKNMIFGLCEKNPKQPIGIFFEEDCKNVIDDLNGEIEQYLIAEGSFLKDWAGKLLGKIYRIAGILHLASGADGDISKEELENAIRIGEYYKAHAEYAYSSQMVDSKMIRIKIVISLLKKIEDGKIESSKLKHDCRKKWFSDPGSFEETLAVLEEKNYIVVQEKGHEKAGRPSKVVFINPEIYDT